VECQQRIAETLRISTGFPVVSPRIFQFYLFYLSALWQARRNFGAEVHLTDIS
jgi:hypothetical protein